MGGYHFLIDFYWLVGFLSFHSNSEIVLVNVCGFNVHFYRIRVGEKHFRNKMFSDARRQALDGITPFSCFQFVKLHGRTFDA